MVVSLIGISTVLALPEVLILPNRSASDAQNGVKEDGKIHLGTI